MREKIKCERREIRGLREVNKRQQSEGGKPRGKREKTLQIVLRARKCKREKIKCVKRERKDYGS